MKVAIIGATGYVGAELVRLLLEHQKVEKIFLSSKSFEGKRMDEIYPSFRNRLDLKSDGILLSAEEAMHNAELVFTALPHGHAEKIADECIKTNKKLIDLSSDFRFGDDFNTFNAYYNCEWKFPKLHKDAVYGLPEQFRNEIKTAHIIGNPGCYVTAVTLALLPLIRKGIPSEHTIIADCKSGVTGAGRNPSLTTIFSECGESCSAYGIGTHRHLGEIERNLEIISGKKMPLVFTPHLIPMNRGIVADVYVPLSNDEITMLMGKQSDIKYFADTVRSFYADFYQNEPFVRIANDDSVPKTKDVRGSNFCDINTFVVGNGKIIQIVSVIDNMVKGAAGQAVQNMNIMCGFSETEGIPTSVLMM